MYHILIIYLNLSSSMKLQLRLCNHQVPSCGRASASAKARHWGHGAVGSFDLIHHRSQVLASSQRKHGVRTTLLNLPHAHTGLFGKSMQYAGLFACIGAIPLSPKLLRFSCAEILSKELSFPKKLHAFCVPCHARCPQREHPRVHILRNTASASNSLC